MIELTTHSEIETIAVARRLARRLQAGDLVAIEGPLGAGKTCFVRGLAEGLGLDPDGVSSPTFVLCQEYEPAGDGSSSRGLTLAHIDAYRMASPDELESIGWDELLRSDDTVVAVEWAGRIETQLPARRLQVRLAHAGPTTRTLTIDGPAALLVGLDAATHACPICGDPAAADGETFPFCSARCRLVDLGKWFGGGYSISRPLSGPDELE